MRMEKLAQPPDHGGARTLGAGQSSRLPKGLGDGSFRFQTGRLRVEGDRGVDAFPGDPSPRQFQKPVLLALPGREKVVPVGTGRFGAGQERVVLPSRRIQVPDQFHRPVDTLQIVNMEISSTVRLRDRDGERFFDGVLANDFSLDGSPEDRVGSPSKCRSTS